jgi:hypothetical protein
MDSLVHTSPNFFSQLTGAALMAAAVEGFSCIWTSTTREVLPLRMEV